MVHAGLDFTLSGGLSGSTAQAIDVLPIKTDADFDYNPPDGSTQCVMPDSQRSWEANMTFRVNGITWQVSIGGSDFNLPRIGAHPALPDTLTGGNSDDPNAVSIDVASDKSPDGVASGSGIGRFDVTYYAPPDHNNGAGAVVINNGATSGTLDIWLTPSEPDSLEFHLAGSWSCV